MSRSSILPWPDLTGACDRAGHVCVGIAHHRSRSTIGRTVFRFYNPDTKSESEVAAHRVSWREEDARTTSILLSGIHEVLVRKGVAPFDRGLLVARNIGVRFYLMEVAKGRLWPRYKWWLPYGLGWTEAARFALFCETLRPEVVGEEDRRPPTEELQVVREDHDGGFRPVSFSGEVHAFIADLLAARKVST